MKRHGDNSDVPLEAERGGRRKRQRARERLAIQELVSGAIEKNIFDSDLGFELIKEWAWGHASAVKVQLYASKAYNDCADTLAKAGLGPGNVPSTLLALKELGSSGRYPNKCHAQLKAWLGQPKVPPPMYAPVSQLITKPRRRTKIVQIVMLPFFLPHLTVSFLWEKFREIFVSKMLGPRGDADKLEEFWTEVERRNDPKLVNHPMKRRKNWRRRAIPITIHGDGVPVIAVGKAGTRSLDNISWQSLLACGSVISVKLWITAIFLQNLCKESIHGIETMDQIWEIIVWSLKWLYIGEHPRDRWDGPWPEYMVSELLLAGTALAGEFFGVVWLAKSDWDYQAKVFKLLHYASDAFCDYCPVDISLDRSMWPTNFSAGAPWKLLCYNSQQWRDKNPSMHILFRTFSFLSILNCYPDELHVFHIGIAQYFIGSVLWLLCYRVRRKTPATNIVDVWELIVAEYSGIASGSQFTGLGISSFVNPRKPKSSWPRLKGRGAEIKSIVRPLLNVWQKVKRGGRFAEHDDCILNALICIDTINNILDCHKYDCFLPDDQAVEFKNNADEFLRAYTWLGNAADSRGDKLFSAVPKLHQFWHWADNAQFLNPRRAANFIDEHFQKVMKDLAAKCTAGTQLHQVPAKMAEKYVWGVYLEDFCERT
jgi:hypothetical protein